MARSTRPGAVATLLAALVAMLPSCSSDPVRSRLIDSLDGEDPKVPAGPLHRPGQPCVACHGGEGPAGSVFSFGGTVYQDRMSELPLPDAKVHIIDANGKTYDTGTNCAGNFFIMKADYDPLFPVFVKIIYGVANGMPIFVRMTSPIYREGSCAMCHADPPGPKAAGHVYLSPDPIPIPPSPSCP